ncbi:MAG: NAD-dependent epimerase/dehydratase family protein [Actinomycetes bacterium]
MKVLVTGGSGFIASHVVDKLAEAGHEPLNYDLRPSPWRDDVEFAEGSITDVDTLERAMLGCEAVMHLAAAADVNEVNADPLWAEDLNARGTACVLEAARRAGVKRVVYSSTIWVYQDNDEMEIDEDVNPALPSHLYTAGKLAGEAYCTSYKALYDLDHTILRFGIPYGPRAREATVLALFVKKALAGEPITLAGGGTQTRRFVYVEDIADGCVAALAPEAANRVYNLVGSEETSIREVAEKVQELLGEAEIVITEGRAGDFAGAVISGERAERELGWTAKTDFAEGARRYVEWHRSRSETTA